MWHINKLKEVPSFTVASSLLLDGSKAQLSLQCNANSFCWYKAEKSTWKCVLGQDSLTSRLLDIFSTIFHYYRRSWVFIQTSYLIMPHKINSIVTCIEYVVFYIQKVKNLSAIVVWRWRVADTANLLNCFFPSPQLPPQPFLSSCFVYLILKRINEISVLLHFNKVRLGTHYPVISLNQP